MPVRALAGLMAVWAAERFLLARRRKILRCNGTDGAQQKQGEDHSPCTDTHKRAPNGTRYAPTMDRHCVVLSCLSARMQTNNGTRRFGQRQALSHVCPVALIVFSR